MRDIRRFLRQETDLKEVNETSFCSLTVKEQSRWLKFRSQRYPLNSIVFFFTGIVNEKIDFMVDARNAGRGKLTGKLTGIKYHTDVEVNDLKDGRYACHYLVPQAGAYVLSLMWNGQHIPDSPYKVTIREAQVMKATSCVVEGEEIS